METNHRSKKHIWKMVYIALVLACLACIGMMLLYLQKEQGEAERIEKEIRERLAKANPLQKEE